MEGELTEEALQKTWDQVVEAKGEYQSRGKSSQVLKSDGIVVFDTPMTFPRGEMKSRVSFHTDGRVAGLFILVPEAL